MKDKLEIDLNGIYSKWGFDDGDMLVDYLGEYPSLEKRCDDMFRLISHFVKGIPLDRYLSCHNPVRAKDANGPQNLKTIELSRQEIIDILNK